MIPATEQTGVVSDDDDNDIVMPTPATEQTGALTSPAKVQQPPPTSDQPSEAGPSGTSGGSKRGRSASGSDSEEQNVAKKYVCYE